MKKNKASKQIYLDRVKCNCVAQKHALINNCLSCGKVVCSREGEGPCLYCGNIVTRPDGKYIHNDETLFPTLTKEELTKVSKQRSKAVLHKNVLVQRDKSTNQVQNIYDESMDYYDVSENQWLDENSRQTAIDRLLEKDKYIENQQFKHKVVFDPLTKRFVTQQFQFDHEQFKEQGRNFLVEEQKKEHQRKMQVAQSKMDNRLMQNEKVKQLIQEIKVDKKTVNEHFEQQSHHNKVTELVIESDDEQTNEIKN